jgi:hypothetical protein
MSRGDFVPRMRARTPIVIPSRRLIISASRSRAPSLRLRTNRNRRARWSSSRRRRASSISSGRVLAQEHGRRRADVEQAQRHAIGGAPRARGELMMNLRVGEPPRLVSGRRQTQRQVRILKIVAKRRVETAKHQQNGPAQRHVRAVQFQHRPVWQWLVRVTCLDIAPLPVNRNAAPLQRDSVAPQNRARHRRSAGGCSKGRHKGARPCRFGHGVVIDERHNVPDRMHDSVIAGLGQVWIGLKNRLDPIAEWQPSGHLQPLLVRHDDHLERASALWLSAVRHRRSARAAHGWPQRHSATVFASFHAHVGHHGLDPGDVFGVVELPELGAPRLDLDA